MSKFIKISAYDGVETLINTCLILKIEPYKDKNNNKCDVHMVNGERIPADITFEQMYRLLGIQQ